MTRLAFAIVLAFGLGATAAAQQQTPAPAFETGPVSFKEVDSNGDGRINRSEADVVPGLDFALADVNSDRVLTRQEFADALSMSAAGSAHAFADSAPLEIPFEQADKNQDGIVDADEAREIDGFNFTAADSDADRALTRAEYRTAMIEARHRG